MILGSPGLYEYSSGHLTMDANRICAMYFCFVGTVTLILALLSKRWISSPHINFGLWKTCTENMCYSHGMNVPAYIHATRAFLIIAVILSFLSFIGYSISCCEPRVGSMCLLKLSGIISCIAGFSAMTAMIIHMEAVRKQHTHGKYYYATEILEGWVSGPFLFVSAALAFLNLTTSEE